MIKRGLGTTIYKSMSKVKDQNQEIIDRIQAEINELYNQGRLYCTMGQYELANMSLTEVIRLDPTNSTCINDWAVVSSKLGKHDEAMVACMAAISLDPTNAVYKNNLSSIYNDWGVAYVKLGQPEQAISAFIKATKIDPTNSMLFNNLGAVYSTAGEYESAIVALNKAIEIDSTNAEYFCNLGLAAFAAGRNEKAVTACIRTTEIDPTNTVYFNNLGAMYLRLNQYKLALEPLFKSICLSDNIDYMTPISSLIELDLSDSEKQKMIEDLIIPIAINNIMNYNAKFQLSTSRC